MNITSTQIKVEEQAINPTLNVWINVEFDYSIEIPFSFSGKLCHNNGKILAILTEYQINTSCEFGLKLLSKKEKEQLYKEKNKNRYSIQLSAVLSPASLDSIENERDKNTTKAVEFYIELITKTLSLPTHSEDLKASDLARIIIHKEFDRVKIEQSDWINNYSKKLGIGNFLLLKLNIPNHNAPKFWLNFFNALKDTITEMEKNIRNGEWRKTMENSRHFFDSVRFNNKEGKKPFKEELNKILTNEQHNQKGIDDLYTAIGKVYHFTSKYAHTTDEKGFHKPKPEANKEDAYFIYTFSVGLLNLIGNKIK